MSYKSNKAPLQKKEIELQKWSRRQEKVKKFKTIVIYYREDNKKLQK